MDRSEEIKIIINYLKADLKQCYNQYHSLVESKIIKYGVLIEKYNKELESLNK